MLPIVQRLAEGKKATVLLLTTDSGATLHRGAVIRALQWEKIGQGRRLHDLRHTAACLWPARRVDVGAVKEWMGHESIATTNLYLHFLGTGADIAGLERLNDDARKGPKHDLGDTRGHETRRRANDKHETRLLQPCCGWSEPGSCRSRLSESNRRPSHYE